MAAELAAGFIDRANRLLGLDLERPVVRINARMRSAAGRAFPGQWRIDLNPHLWRRVGAAFPRATTGHEVAHLVDWSLTGDTNHGPGWRRIMALFDLPPQATHQWDVSGLRRSAVRHAYACACRQPHQLGTVRHRRIQRGTVYRCLRCGEALRPLSPADRVPAWQ